MINKNPDLIEFYFENDHEQYMSLGDIKSFIPASLEERAKAALKELQEIHDEFQRIISEYEVANAIREEQFEEAFTHFQESKDHWERIEDEHGNIHWIDTSYLPKKPMEDWPFGDASWTV